METLQVKKLSCKEDLAKLVAKDIVEFGLSQEKCVVHDYQGLKKGELCLVSRLEWTGIPGGIGVIIGGPDIFYLRNEKGMDAFIDRMLIERKYKSGFCERDVNELYEKGIAGDQIAEKVFEPLQKTSDEKLIYGVNLIVKKAEKESDKKFENPELYKYFDRVLKEVDF